MDGIEGVLLRAREVACLLGLGRSKTYELITSGQLPTVRIGRTVRVPKGPLLDWIRQNTRKAAE